MLRTPSTVVPILTGLTLALPAAAQDCVDIVFEEDFDDLAEGLLVPQDPDRWEGFWGDEGGAQVLVTAEQPNSKPHAIRVEGADDLVALLHDIDFIPWRSYVVSFSVFVPEDFTGEQYFIALNQYAHGGPMNWSTQVRFRSSDQTIESDFDGGSLPLITGAYVPCEVRINLAHNRQTFLYGDDVLYVKSWTEGITGGGVRTLQALNLFANGGSAIYYDDFQICEVAPCADLDDSGRVDFSDILYVLSAWGFLEGPEDLDRNGLVDFADVLYVLARWGQSCQL